jgi:DNA-damage-inducible protein J
VSSLALSTRIDHDTKVAFTYICDEVGLSPSQAIKIFAKAVINHGGIPFDVIAKQPNSITLNAIQKLENGLGNKANDVKQLFKELGEGKLDNVSP